jgi:crotonobetainyl-CoA:carnitine CoA-transferase CaiB-like acyl-CoA transferase
VTHLPLQGIRVVEFSQMVMGPCCGLLLADLGAEVIKIEPMPSGDRSRYLTGMAAGFFAAFNRNKKSLAVDIKSPDGVRVIKKVIESSDVLIENFRPGMMAKMNLDYASLKPDNPHLIYCSLKGFQPGPYEKRTALDEVVQMMGGLAYLSGLPGRPMRAGASVNDIMGAMFGAIAVFAALQGRSRTGEGQEVTASLFENNAFLVSQTIAAETLSCEPAIPWSVTSRPWPIYDLFDTADGKQLFVGTVGDGQWRDFCEAFEKPEWITDGRFQSNSSRVEHREWIKSEVKKIFSSRTMDELSTTLERSGLPFAPVQKPIDLLDDPQLNMPGGLIDMTMPNGQKIRLPALPISLDGHRLGKRCDPPAVGADTISTMYELGFREDEVVQYQASGVIGTIA